MYEWWDKWPDQKFWLEATDRQDIGADLRAPQLDESGKDNWRYTLFMGAKPGNIVLHYDSRTEPNGIVGWSVVAGAPRAEPITWGARGSYAREKGIKPHERAGYVIPLSGFQRLATPVTLTRIRALEPTLAAVLADLKRKYREPLYFPFELSPKRPLGLSRVMPLSSRASF